MKKASKIVPRIIECQTREEAISILEKVVEELHLSSDYIYLNTLKDRMDYYQQQVTLESNKLKTLEVPHKISDLNSIRTNLNFIYRDITDELSFEINKVKIFHEENKSAIRGNSMLELAKDEETQKAIKAKSTSALRDIYGSSKEYQQYVQEYSIAYGLYKNLDNLLNSIRMLVDSIAAEVQYLRVIESKNQN